MEPKRRLVLLTGAGFSFDAGLPLVNRLTERFLNTAKHPSVIAAMKRQNKATVVDSFMKLLDGKNLNYEDLLGWLYLSQYRHEHRDNLDDFASVRLRMTDLVYHLLLADQIKSNASREGWVGRYKGFFKICENHHPLRVFSLNHDLVIEDICEHYKIPLESGFGMARELVKYTKDQKTFPFSSFSLEDYKSAKLNLLNEGTKGVNLYKVHGGLDFFTAYDQSKFVRVKTGSVRTDLAALWDLSDRQKDGVNVFGEIIVDDEKGETQFLRRVHVAGTYKFNPAKPQNLPEEVLKRFRADINFADDLVTIGYSFGDLHINDAVRGWIEHNSKRKLWIVDPNLTSIPMGLRHYYEQVKVLQMKTNEFLENYNPEMFLL